MSTTKPTFRQAALASDRAIVDGAFLGTGAAPGAAPTLVTDGFDCRDLTRVAVAVSADQASSAGLSAVVTPWYWMPVDADPAGAGETYAWHKGSPMSVPLDYAGSVGQIVRIDCEFAERLYLQVVPEVGCTWARAKCFIDLLRGETAVVMAAGLTTQDITDALLTVLKGPIPIAVQYTPWQSCPRGAANLPQTAQVPYFQVAGGRILLHGIIGLVTTGIQDAANNARLIMNPAAAADVDLCADLNIKNDAIGTMYSITGTLGDAMVESTSGVAPMQAKPTIVPVGTIDFKCDASKTGQTSWVVLWEAIDAGAVVTAL